MKKVYSLSCMLALFVALTVASCTGIEKKKGSFFEKSEKVKVLATTSIICDLVSQIGKDDIDCIALIRGELDPHSYEIVKGDDEKFASADIIFYNGLGLEHGLSLRQNLEGNPKAVALGEKFLSSDPTLIVEIDGQWDPHFWLDISLFAQVIDPIVEKLSVLDPKHEKEFRLRGEGLKKAMMYEDQMCLNLLKDVPSEKRFLVTSHDAFNYFARRYLADEGEMEWKKRCIAPEGLSPESEMSVTDIINVLSHMEKYKISVIFAESNVSKDSLKKILNAGKEKGLEIRFSEKSLYSDSMGRENSYLAMIKHNARAIAEELKSE